MKNNKLITTISLSVVLLSILSSCSSSEKKEDETNTPEQVIETFKLKKDKLATSIQLPGELIAFQQVDLYAKVTSFVKELKVDIGSEVTAGQLLITLEAPEISSQLAEAESKLNSQEALYAASKANYDRMLESSKVPGTISKNDLDQAIAKQNSDLAQLNAAKAFHKEISVMQSYLEIRAPFDGIITARNVNLGAYVGPAGKGSELPLFTLQEQKHLRLAVSIPEVCTGYLKNEDDIHFTVPSLPGEIFTAKVKRMAGALDLRLRAERVEMNVDNSDKKLLPGMVAEVSIDLPAKDSTYIVPRTAVVNSAEGVYVIKVVNAKTEKVTVKKGRQIKDKMEVFGLLASNDIIIAKAHEEIKDGTDIKVR
jgi:RND family efflux transporter MFP subunit